MKVTTTHNNPILSEKEYLDNEWQADWTSSSASGPIDGAEDDAQFKKEMAEGEGEGEYYTAGGGSYLGMDGAEGDAQFKAEMAEGEGEGEYYTAGGGSYLGFRGKTRRLKGMSVKDRASSIDGPESDAQFKAEMAEGEGEGEYWTAGGGSYLGMDGVVDNFAAKIVRDGPITVKTDNPVYQDTALEAKQFMSNFMSEEVDVDVEEDSEFLGSRANRRARRNVRKGRGSKRNTKSRRSSGAPRKRSGKLKGFLGKVGNFAKDSGLLDYGAQQLQNRVRGGGVDPGMDPGMDPNFNVNPNPPIVTDDEGMSTTTKIAIGVGIVALGVGGYFLYKKMGKGKSKSKK